MSESYRKLLAFDCSGASCSAAVYDKRGVAAERFEAMQRGQAEALLPMIQAVMLEAALDFAELDTIVTTTGPGSFTGLRIGIAAARGLALALDIPTIGVTAFESVYQALPPERRRTQVAVVIDSRRGPVFTRCFDPTGGPTRDALAIEPDELLVWLAGKPTSLAGDGISRLEAMRGEPTITMPKTPDFIRAGSVAITGAKAALGRGNGAALLKPLYLRSPDVTLAKLAMKSVRL